MRPKVASVFVALFIPFALIAQIDVDIDLGGKEWYEEPWVMPAAVVALLLIFLLLRRKGRS